MGSPHDQYYFKRPGFMVAGAVTPPRLDLTNEDLIRAHIHSVWLAETGLSLGKSLKDLLNLTDGDEPSLKVLDFVQAALDSDSARKKAHQRAKAILISIEDLLKQADWYSETWLEGVLNQIPLQFSQACERWKGLYRAAKGQQKAQQKIINDHSRSKNDHDQAKRLRQEAESQIELLTESENLVQSDFYSYRYFASEGFLPGAAVGEQGLAGLINNAGIAHNGPLMHVPLDEFRKVFEVNVVGALAVTQAFLPLLGARRDCPHPPGRVINITSITGAVTFPLFATYAVSKHGMEALSDGLRRELAMYGIEVSAIEPGTIQTPIWDKAPKDEVETRFAGTDYAAVMASLPTVVARQLKGAKPVSVVTDAIVAALE